MYDVSQDYKRAIKQPVIFSSLTFTISGDNTIYTDANILEGSFSITNQCTDTSDIKLGAVYVGELNGTFRGVNIGRNYWVGKEISPVFHLKLEDGTYEDVPLGIFIISKATWTRAGVEVVAYDYMSKLDRNFSLDQAQGYLYDFLAAMSDSCGISLAQTEEELKEMPNGNYLFSYYSESDVETWRDLLSWIAQTYGGYATVNRAGEVEIRYYHSPEDVVDTLDMNHRFDDGSFSDYITKYTGISYVDIEKQSTIYHGAEVDDGTTMNLGSNPFLQKKSIADLAVVNILDAVSNIRYTPFKGEKVNDPSYDLGDVIEFTGGIAGTSSVCCLQKFVFSHHQKYEMSGYGANPAEANAKSKTDKSISGLINSGAAGGDQMHFYEVRNVSEIRIGSGANRNILRVKIAATKATRVQIHVNINLETHSDAEGEPTIVAVTYLIDGITAYLHPIETYFDGNHVLHLMYILPLGEGVISNFIVNIMAENGTIFIDRQWAWLYASGYGIVGDAEWDGTIDIDEVQEPIPINEPSFQRSVEDVDITTRLDTSITASDSTSEITIEPFTHDGADERILVIRHNTAYQRTSESGDVRITEDDTTRYTEEEI